jgi:hypothetical protein
LLSPKDFAAEASRLVQQSVQDSKRPLNPLVMKALREKPPNTMKDVAGIYGDLLNAIDKRWQEYQAAKPATAKPQAAWDPAEEELRQVLYGPGAPPNVTFLPYGDLSLLPDRPSQAKLQELRKALETWRATGPGAPPRAMVLEDLPTLYEPQVFLRGNPNNRGERVLRQMPVLLRGETDRPFTKGSGRLELAQAIVSRDNPLTARVLVNRIWLHYFGKGLVGTPSDFGLRSEPPTHPELLDYLAATFMESGWSIKKMHRLILLSRVYQQRSDDRPECAKVDPDNTLLWKMNRRRLDFEATRDALLAVSGKLDRSIGGPSIKDITAANASRRTIYGHLDRLNVPGLWRTFDYPSPDATSPNRVATTVPQQALFLMNHPFVQTCAANVMKRPEIQGETDVNRRVHNLYRLLYGRQATIEEVTLGCQYLEVTSSHAAWPRYVQALMVANEFVFVD